MKKHKLLKYLRRLSEYYKSHGAYKQASAMEGLAIKLEENSIDELLYETKGQNKYVNKTFLEFPLKVYVDDNYRENTLKSMSQKKKSCDGIISFLSKQKRSAQEIIDFIGGEKK